MAPPCRAGSLRIFGAEAEACQTLRGGWRKLEHGLRYPRQAPPVTEKYTLSPDIQASLVGYGSLQMASRSSSRKLRRLSRRPIQARDIETMHEEYVHMTDQATALVFCAMVERSLERAILSRMVRMRKKDRLGLFEGLGPIASIAAKIKIAASLGIVGPNASSDLEIIKNIRNQFAHSFHRITFDTKSVAAECSLLKTTDILRRRPVNRDMPNEPRDRYAYSCWGIWRALSGEAANGPRPKRSRDSYSRMLLC